MRLDPAFDGVLSLAALWDRAKADNGGFRIYATRPKALRDRQGQLTRADGSLILGDLRNPFKNRAGRRTWRPGDTPQTDWRHPGAVIVGTERHPQADKVPVLGRKERRRLFFGPASDGLTSSARSMAADRADAMLRRMETRGYIKIETEPDGWRILEVLPGSKGTADPGLATPTLPASCPCPWPAAPEVLATSCELLRPLRGLEVPAPGSTWRPAPASRNCGTLPTW